LEGSAIRADACESAGVVILTLRDSDVTLGVVAWLLLIGAWQAVLSGFV
jgi:hypothetical protein